MKYYAPAKINLFLHNNGKRADGYHEIETIFVLLDLCDELTITKTTDGTISRTHGNEDIPECVDLSIKAAYLLQKTTQTSYGARIGINKNIPVGGGLGGGSSNAATVLMALNTLWQTQLNTTELQKIGVQLGADVPIFLTKTHAFATGIGEKITPMKVEQKYYLILSPNDRCSTAKIFSHIALTSTPKQGKIPNFLQAISFSNDCLEAAIDESPIIKELMDFLNLTKGKISPAKLSGTGSCVFAIYENKKLAEIALKNLSCKKTNTFITKSI